MNNWKQVAKEILEECPKYVCGMTDNHNYSDGIYGEAVIAVVNRHTHNQNNLFEAIDWLTQEAESEVPKSKEELMEEVGCDGCDGCYRDEPQQSKARFVEAWWNDKRCIIDPNEITAFVDMDFDKSRTFVSIKGGGDKVYRVDKPVDEVIQQLGIEVV